MWSGTTQKKKNELSVTEGVPLILVGLRGWNDLMCNVEACLTFLKFWLIISRVDTGLFTLKKSRALYGKVDFSVC